MGKAFLRTNMLEKARECFETVLDNGERAHEVQFYLGVIAFRKKEYESAAEHFKKLLEIRTDSVHAYSNLGLSLEKLGRTKEAMLVYNAGLEMSPSSSLLLANRGVFRCKTGDWQGAVRDLSKALKKRPGVGFLLFYLSLALIKLGRPADAKERLEEALDSEPRHPAILNNLGYVSMVLDSFHAARRFLTMAARISDTPDAAFGNLAELYARRGDPEMCILMARKAFPGDDVKAGEHIENLAEDLAHAGRHTEAGYLLRQAAELKAQETSQPGQEKERSPERREDSQS